MKSHSSMVGAHGKIASVQKAAGGIAPGHLKPTTTRSVWMASSERVFYFCPERRRAKIAGADTLLMAFPPNGRSIFGTDHGFDGVLARDRELVSFSSLL